MGFENDKLNREGYADFLTEITGNPDKYKRISDSKSLSIAIDSSWGSGKTTFINMWQEKLERQLDDDGKEKFVVISYNAWKNDFAENPFESLVYTIINHKVFNINNEIEGAQEAGKNILKTGIKLGKALVKMKASKAYGEEIGELVEKVLETDIDSVRNVMEFINNKKTIMNNFFKEYKEYLDAIEELKQALNKIAEKKTIIIIIDELDRCKPLFAIKLLESIKHILDVPNISFVFALDMEQLSHSIKCIYGQEMDASGYLCRFFDYISKMPKADTTEYIKFLIESQPLFRENLINYRLYEGPENIHFSDMFENFSRNMNLSLRDINTIYANFRIFEEQNLKDVACMQAYSLYLMLLILKYKYLYIFNEIFLTNNCNIDSQYIFSNYNARTNKYFDKDTLKFIMNKENISEIQYTIQDSQENISHKKINVTETRVIALIDIFNSKVFDMNESLNISNCLFQVDVRKWEEIKNKSLVKYIQEKLEFFDFKWETQLNEGGDGSGGC